MVKDTFTSLLQEGNFCGCCKEVKKYHTVFSAHYLWIKPKRPKEFQEKSVNRFPRVDQSKSFCQTEAVIQPRPMTEHLPSSGSRCMGQNIVQMTV